MEKEVATGELLVRLIGDLDMTAFDEVDANLSKARLKGKHRVVVDLRRLDFVDSTGIRLLLKAHVRAKKVGTELSVVRGNPQIQRLFALTDLDGRLPFCDAP